MKIHLMLALQTVWVPPYLPEVQNNVIQNQKIDNNQLHLHCKNARKDIILQW